MENNNSLKILFVDDSIVIRDMLEHALIQIGYLNIRSAADGIEALDLCEDVVFDFIITDINMPNMNGIELITELREKHEYEHTPIMVLSTERSDEMKQLGKEVGATSWVVKPFDTELIRKAIDATINRVNRN
jgi:two-component system chemotaxis response regulator CheY